MRSLRRRLGAFIRGERATASVIAALALVPLCGFAGLALDLSTWYEDRRQLQRIVEVSAMSAAPLLSNSTYTGAMVTAAAQNVATLNGLSTGAGDAVAVTVAADRSTLTVSATRTLSMRFSSLFISGTRTTSAAATARPGANPICIMTLDPTGSQSLLVNSNVNITAPSCEIAVTSKNSGAAMINSSFNNISSMCIAGGATINGGSTIHNLSIGCSVPANPYVGKLPAPTVGGCTDNGGTYTGTTNLSPGTYCGSFNFNGSSGTLNLAPGLYIFSGCWWVLNSGWTVSGTGVTFYFTNTSSGLSFNQGTKISLSAPTSGSYANILMYEPDGLSQTSLALDGSASTHFLQGLIYLPSRGITFNSSSNVTTDSLTLVARDLTFDTMTWSIAPSPFAIGGSGSGVISVLTQ